MLIKFEEIKNHFSLGIPRGILHIGAHNAEELDAYTAAGIETVAWVEANPMLFASIMKKIGGRPGSTMHWFAAHERDGEVIDLNVANNGESSSILELGTHKTEHPHIHYVGKIPVPTRTIDTFFKSSGLDPIMFDFVNIDIQGAELLALKGMKKHLKNVKYLYLEVNEKMLYEGCALIEDIDNFLLGYGFKRVLTEMTQHGWGDALYSVESNLDNG